MVINTILQSGPLALEGAYASRVPPRLPLKIPQVAVVTLSLRRRPFFHAASRCLAFVPSCAADVSGVPTFHTNGIRCGKVPFLSSCPSSNPSFLTFLPKGRDRNPVLSVFLQLPWAPLPQGLHVRSLGASIFHPYFLFGPPAPRNILPIGIGAVNNQE